MLPGPFAYAERWDEASGSYAGLAIEKSPNSLVAIDVASVVVRPEVAEASKPKPATVLERSGLETGEVAAAKGFGEGGVAPIDVDGNQPIPAPKPPEENKPTRFLGTVTLSADRPARDMHHIVEAIVEQLTTLPGAEVTLKLEIDAEVASGLDRAKVRTLMENASTSGKILSHWNRL